MAELLRLSSDNITVALSKYAIRHDGNKRCLHMLVYACRMLFVTSACLYIYAYTGAHVQMSRGPSGIEQMNGCSADMKWIAGMMIGSLLFYLGLCYQQRRGYERFCQRFHHRGIKPSMRVFVETDTLRIIEGENRSESSRPEYLQLQAEVSRHFVLDEALLDQMKNLIASVDVLTTDMDFAYFVDQCNQVLCCEEVDLGELADYVRHIVDRIHRKGVAELVGDPRSSAAFVRHCRSVGDSYEEDGSAIEGAVNLFAMVLVTLAVVHGLWILFVA